MQQYPFFKKIKESSWTEILTCVVMVLALFLDCLEYMRQPLLNNYESRPNVTTTINDITIIVQPEDPPEQAKNNISESDKEPLMPEILPCEPDEGQLLPKLLPLRY